MQPRAVSCFDRRAAPRKTASIERDHSANGGDHRCARAQKKAARKFERPSPINTIEESQLFRLGISISTPAGEDVIRSSTSLFAL